MIQNAADRDYVLVHVTGSKASFMYSFFFIKEKKKKKVLLYLADITNVNVHIYRRPPLNGHLWAVKSEDAYLAWQRRPMLP